MLSDSDSDSESLHQLTINEHYAKAFARKKEREELQKLKEKYGSDAEELDESEDSEENETEDEDGEELTPAVDAAILRTLARIKKRDPSIYEKDKDVFEEEQQKTKTDFQLSQGQKDKSKPLRMHQHILNSQLKEGSRSPSPEPKVMTHAEEQEALRKETISAFKEAVPEEEDDFLVPRELTKDEIEKQNEEYKQFLAREVGDDIKELVTVEENTTKVVEEDETEEYAPTGKKKKSKSKGKERQKESDQEFLMNYILNRGWIDRSERHVPTYREVTGSSSKRIKRENTEEAEGGDASGSDNDGTNVNELDELDELEEFEEIAETFESSYNFRFEEPDGATIPSHPRQIDSIARRKDTSRKEARERKKARKEEKLLQKREEIKRLKALKLKEIREKLERIGKEGGVTLDDEAMAELDLEGDWDPDKHDRQMREIYGKQEEGEEIEGEDVDLEKPTWNDDIDISDIVGPSSTKKKKKKDKGKKAVEEEDEGVDIDEMDADAQPQANEEEWDGTEETRKRKLDEYMEELYSMEFNDMVGDLPTRFKYVPVLPQTYGLTPTEILLADDKDLNQYVGLRKIAPYRKDKGQSVYKDPKRVDKLKELKSKLRAKASSIGIPVTGSNATGQKPEKKRKGKKERLKAKLAAGAGSGEGASESGDGAKNASEEPEEQENGQPPAKKRKRKHKKADVTES